MTYELKKELEDFQVEEILKKDLQSTNPTNILLCLLTKKNYTTERAVQQIVRSLHLQRKNINYAGAKDKQAITKQFITIAGRKKEQIEKLELKDINIEIVGFAKRQLRLGDLEGNRFKIILRNVTEEIPEVKNSFLVPNYFDEQRFSTKNIEVGLAILKGEFEKAVSIIEQNDDDYKDEIKNYLKTHKNDYVGALKKIPRKILLFYMHSIQSKLFNDDLANQIRRENSAVKELTFDFGTLVFPTKLIDVNEEKLSETTKLIGWDSTDSSTLNNWGLNTRNFLIKSFPELSLSEAERPSYSLVDHFLIKSLSEDNTYQIEFTLRKGSYATIVLKQLFGRSN